MADISPSIQTIFNEAIEQESQEKVSAYLDEACGGDVEKRQRVEALVRAITMSQSRAPHARRVRIVDRSCDRVHTQRVACGYR